MQRIVVARLAYPHTRERYACMQRIVVARLAYPHTRERYACMQRIVAGSVNIGSHVGKGREGIEWRESGGGLSDLKACFSACFRHIS
jgi:hypothetical protein